jgi:transposase
MFLRRIRQTRQGQSYTYYAIAETARLPDGRVRQRTVCYLGRLDNLRPPDWLRIAERLPDPAWLPLLMQEVGYTPPTTPSGPVAGMTVDPASVAWANPRHFGDVFVAWRAWQLLGLDQLLDRLLQPPRRRGRRQQVPMPTLAAMIAVNRLVAPRSERGIFAWLPKTALPELLGVPRDRLSLNALYRCLSATLPHKAALERHLVEQGRDLFAFDNDLILYDLTSTYFEGHMAGNAKAQRGYSRDHRPDCKQLCIGLAVNRVGFPLGFEVLNGKARDAATLTPAIEKLEARCGGTKRIVCFDRGMATEANLRHWRLTKRTYLCAVRRAVTRQHLPAIRTGAWQTVQARGPTDRGPTDRGPTDRGPTDRGPTEPTIEVQALPDQECDGVRERWLLCRSAGCQLKERQMFEARLAKARANLMRLQAQVADGTFTSADVIRRKASRAVGRTHDLRGIFSWQLQRTPATPATPATPGTPGTQGTPTGKQLSVQENDAALRDQRDLHGVYLLRTTAADLTAPELWQTYMLLTKVETAFRDLKTDLVLRPIFHHKEQRADAHVLFAVLAYAMSVTLQLRHRANGGALTTPAMLETLERVQLAELSFRTLDGATLRFERASVPSAEQQRILDSLGWLIPPTYLPPNLGADPARL